MNRSSRKGIGLGRRKVVSVARYEDGLPWVLLTCGHVVRQGEPGRRFEYCGKCENKARAALDEAKL